MKRALFVLVWSLAFVGACMSNDRKRAGARQAKPVELQVVESHVAAFNRRDVQALSTDVAEDFALFALTDDSLVVETRGRKAFQEWMSDYFRGVDSVQSVLEETMSVGAFVAVREKVSWGPGDRRRSARSLGIYEVRDGIIRRAWYFPPVE